MPIYSSNMPKMPENSLYEYALVRYVPDEERGEFVNIGLIMMCKRRNWLRLAINLPATRLDAFRCPHTHEEIMSQLQGMVRVADMTVKSGPFAEYRAEERFRWLTAWKSACLQTSRPHPGMCRNLDETFDRLFSSLVL